MPRHITIFKSAIALLTMCQLAGSAAPMQTTISAKVFVDPDLELVVPSSPNFLPAVLSFAQQQQITRIRQFGLLPFSVLLINHGKRQLAAGTLVLTSTPRSGGPPSKRSELFYSLDAGDSSRFFIGPGQSRLLTPSHEINMGLFAQGFNLDAAPVGNALDWATQQGHINYALNSVIDTSGFIAGEDTLHTEDRLNGQIAAIHDLTSQVQAKLAAPAGKEEDVSEWLKKIANQDLSAKYFNGVWDESYVQTQRAYADVFLGRLQNEGRSITNTLIPHLLDDTNHIPLIHRNISTQEEEEKK